MNQSRAGPKPSCLARAGRVLLLNALLPKCQRPHAKTRFKVGVLLRGGVGDWILASPALERFVAALRSHDVELTIHAESRHGAIASLIGLHDRLVLIDAARGKGLIRRHRILAQLRREHYDVWIDADISRTNLGDAMSLASAAPLRIGYAARPDLPCHALIEKRAFDRLLAEEATVHMRTRFERLFAFSWDQMLPRVSRHGSEDHTPSNGLRQFRWIGQHADYCVIAPGASSPQRIWPAERFAQLAARIATEHGLHPVVIGAHGDRSACDAVAQHYGGHDLVNRVGQDSLSDVFKRIAGARLLVTNDSGPMHIGRWTQTPTLAIASGADFCSYAAYPDPSPNFCVAHSDDQSCFNCRWNCMYPSHGQDAIKPCLAAVDVATASTLINGLFKRTAPSARF